MSRGFTLIETILVMAIFALLAGVLLQIVDPVSQLNKTRDARQQSELAEIKTAIELYYGDLGCYPKPELVNFGGTFSEGGRVYMKLVPKSSGSTEYIYQTDLTGCPSCCPQWAVLYAKRMYKGAQSPDAITTCPLKNFGSCLPSNSQNYLCSVSGNIDCDYISGTTLP